MMDFFFQRHFRRRQNRQAHASVTRLSGPAVQVGKARRRSSVGLPSIALVQSRRSSVGLPPVCADQCRRPSAGALVASGLKRQTILDLANAGEVAGEFGRGGDKVIKRRRGSHSKPYHVYRGLAVRYRRPSKVKSIEPHLLGSSMLLASLVQMGSGEKNEEEEEEEEEEHDGSLSYGEEDSDEDVGQINDETHLTQAVFADNIASRPLLRPPRCLRRNSSHLLPAESECRSNEAGYGGYGGYKPERSNQPQWKPIQTSTTSPSLGQLTSGGPRSGPGDDAPDVTLSGSALHKSCSSPLGGPVGTIHYNPYLDTWESFLSYVTPITHI